MSKSHEDWITGDDNEFGQAVQIGGDSSSDEDGDCSAEYVNLVRGRTIDTSDDDGFLNVERIEYAQPTMKSVAVEMGKQTISADDQNQQYYSSMLAEPEFAQNEGVRFRDEMPLNANEYQHFSEHSPEHISEDHHHHHHHSQQPHQTEFVAHVPVPVDDDHHQAKPHAFRSSSANPTIRRRLFDDYCQQPAIRYKINYDPHPTVIHKQATNCPPVYNQNVTVKYFKPPPLPRRPGPIIIREQRPPQPPPAPPLVIHQKPHRPCTPPPLILRELPPKPPIIPGPKVITKRLPRPSPPPRQVIIQRHASLPPKPRDIIFERWLPYPPLPKRQVVYRKAPPPCIRRPPKNVVVQYHCKYPKIIRRYRSLGVHVVDPDSYIASNMGKMLPKQQISQIAHKFGVHDHNNVVHCQAPAYRAGSYSDLCCHDHHPADCCHDNYKCCHSHRQHRMEAQPFRHRLCRSASFSGFV